MNNDGHLRDIRIFPEELGKIFEQAYKDLPGVSRGAIHSLILRGVKYSATTPCANCERLEDQLYHESRKAPEVEYKLGHEIEVLKKQLEMCKEALEEIKLKSGMCVFGTAEMAEDPVQAFRQGSHIAFNECAHIATQALAKLEKE